jgi:hypothetical protein
MKKDFAAFALVMLLFMVMYVIGEGIIETVKAVCHAFS